MKIKAKNRCFALVTAREGFLYKRPVEVSDAEPDAAGTVSASEQNEITDEVLSGWALEVLEGKGFEACASAWAYVRTFYGYEGWIRREDMRAADEAELYLRRDKTCFMRIGARSADILPSPKVQGVVPETLLQDSVVEVLESPSAPDGWKLVKSAAGTVGWVFAAALAQRCDDDGFLLENDPAYFLKKAQRIIQEIDETALRERAVRSAASYLGCTYRWGGKSPLGIDCSGLVFMSWMEQGILIYRDAHLQEGFPVREIGRDELKKGDLIFFPGHVAMYLGEGRYIHATGALSSPCVRINSLCDDAPDYREDLAKNIVMCGSIF